MEKPRQVKKVVKIYIRLILEEAVQKGISSSKSETTKNSAQHKDQVSPTWPN